MGWATLAPLPARLEVLAFKIAAVWIAHRINPFTEMCIDRPTCVLGFAQCQVQRAKRECNGCVSSCVNVVVG